MPCWFAKENALVVSLVLGASACERQWEAAVKLAAPAPVITTPAVTTPVVATPLAAAAPAEEPPAASVTVLGMTDAFSPLPASAWRAFAEARRLGREGHVKEARAAFAAIAAAHPSHTEAAFEEIRMAVRAGDVDAVPELWRGLLAKDFVRYHRRLAGWRPLTSSPAWPAVKAITAAMKAAHAGGLSVGVTFVARSYVPAPVQFDDGQESAPLTLDQEIYHFEPDSRRVRRLTDTGGRVVAIHRAPGASGVLVLMAGGLAQRSAGPAFTEVAVASLQQGELQPLPLDGIVARAEMCFGAAGEPVWVLDGGTGVAPRFTVDAGVLVTTVQECGSAPAVTLVGPRDVVHVRGWPEGVAQSEDGLSLTGVDGDRTVRAPRPIRLGSGRWSPDGKRFVFSGEANRCDMLGQTGAGGERNQLLAWDAEARAAAAVDTAPAAYEAEWVDDGRVVFEAGVGRAAKLVLHDFGSVRRSTIAAPAGAALFGLPVLPCPEADPQ